MSPMWLANMQTPHVHLLETVISPELPQLPEQHKLWKHLTMKALLLLKTAKESAKLRLAPALSFLGGK